MTKKSLRVLMVEDSEDDAMLLLRELKRGGYEPSFLRVETPEAMSQALTQSWQIIVSDYSMPRFSGPAAFALMKSKGTDIPFIIVSGTIGEDTAVEALQMGAQDYLIKGRLARLIPSIERAIAEQALRCEKKKMEEQLLVSERMASVGTLAAGVAHEINNPLAVFMANLSYAMAKLSETTADVTLPAQVLAQLELIREPLSEAQEAAERVCGITRDLKVFSRGDDERRNAVDLRGVIESSIRMARNEIRHRARLVKDYQDVPAVLANESRLGQVFLNLVVNAAQAIAEGKADKNEIRVTTRHDVATGRVIAEIHDTGPGIPPEIRARIFDPFFTTKPIGVGTGLGLAICHRIISSMGGDIAVESEPGHGTTFRVTFLSAPATAEKALTFAAPAAPVATTVRARIAIVDDEIAIGTTIRRVLGAKHEVIPITAAREAIARIAGGERFDVIVCDLMMPEITGMDLHDELLRLTPDQAARMVFTTGGAFSSPARLFLERVGNPRLEKPFDITRLETIINDVRRGQS